MVESTVASNVVFVFIGAILFGALAVFYSVRIIKNNLKTRWFIAPIYVLVVLALALILQVAWIFGLGFFVYFIDTWLTALDDKDAKEEKRRAREENAKKEAENK